MAGLSTIISFVVVFGILVMAHEFGHFIVARLNGITVHEFAIGMGPKVFSRQGKETLYSLRAIPLGGFVMLHGEDEELEGENSFSNKKPWQRLLVLVAGSGMNMILAFVLILGLTAFWGFPGTENVVGEVYKEYPAYKMGLQPGDQIVKIDGVAINDWNDVVSNISANPDQEITIVYTRTLSDGQKKELESKVTPMNEGNQGRIGILPQAKREVVGVIKYGFIQTGVMLTQTLRSLWSLITGAVSVSQVSGIVGIAEMTGKVAQTGIPNLMGFAAFLSINLAIMNMLPIPALDGGRIFFVLFEMIFRKPFNKQWEQNMHVVGFFILIALMVLLVFKDLSKWFGGTV